MSFIKIITITHYYYNHHYCDLLLLRTFRYIIKIVQCLFNALIDTLVPPPKVVVTLTKEEKENTLTGYPKFDTARLKGEQTTVHLWDPSTMDYFGSVKAMDKKQVEAIVAKGKAAQNIWKKSTFSTRKKLMKTMLR